MSLLYAISNICIPFSLLIFETLKRGSQGKQANFGKWLVLFMITFIFNGLSIFNSWVITLVDLCLKIGIYFLPDNMNQIIEDRIRNLHFEGVIQSYRCKILNKMFDFYNKMTHILLSQLREEESQQFGEALISSLQNKQTKTQLTLQPKQKLMSINEVQCTIISQKNIEQAKALFDKKLQYIQKQKQELQKSKVEFEKRSNSNKKYQAEKEYPQVKAEKPIKKKAQISKAFTRTMPAEGFKSKAPQTKQLESSSSIKHLAQSSQFLPEDFEAQEEEKPVSKLIYSRNKEEVPQKPVESKKAVKKQQGGGLKRSNTTLQNLKITQSNVASRERSYSPDGSSLREQAQILEKLDLSVSQYSDMFEEEDGEDEKDEAKKIVCKVEAIVQIGSAPNNRLEIYNLQLYSNRDLRIVSLYNREFEKHKLVSVSKGINSYYDLFLSGTTVTKRRVKFRGQHQAFLKYLQQK